MNQVNKTEYKKRKYSNASNKSRKRIRSALERTTGETRQKNILRKLNPPPKPEPEDDPEQEVEPEVKRVPSLSQSVEVTGPRSCRHQKCAFRSFPNSAPAAAPHNDGVTLSPEEELKKELKRKRNCERQRAYYHRQKDLKKNEEKEKKKKKVPKTNAERQREFRQRKAEKSYVDMKRRKLYSNEENVVQGRAVENIENVTLQENQFHSQQLHIYEQRNECITPEVSTQEHRNYWRCFPSMPGQDSKWARHESRANGAPFWPRLNSRVYLLHFPPELVTTDRAGAPALQRGAVPSAEPYQKREVPNITQTRIMRTEMVPSQNYQENGLDIKINSKLLDEKSLIPDKEIDETIQNTLSDNLYTDITVKSEDCYSDGETIQTTLSDNLNTDITVKSEDCDSDEETIQNTLSDNLYTDITVKSEDCYSDGETIQTTLSDNLNTDVTVKSEDCDSDEETIQNTLSDNLYTDITVKSEDCYSDGETIQTTLSDNLDTDITVKSEDYNSDGETIQNTVSDNLNTHITVKSEDCDSDEEIIQNTLSDNLDTDIIVKSEDCDSDGETEETIIGEADTSAGIQSCDDDLDETVIVKIECESDSDNGLKPET